MDAWGFEQLRPWLARRVEMPVGTLFCVIDGQTRGRPWTPAAARNLYASDGVISNGLSEGMVTYRTILPKPGKAHRIDHLNPQTMDF